MFVYTVPIFYDIKEDMKVRFVKNQVVYNFILKNERGLISILNEIHTGKIIDRGDYIELVNNSIKISKIIYNNLKEHKNLFTEVLENSLKLGIWETNSRIVMEKFSKVSAEKNLSYVYMESSISQESKTKKIYNELDDLIEGIRNDYFNPFISLFFLPIEKNSLNFTFNPNCSDKEDSELIIWFEKLILVLEEKIKEIKLEENDFQYLEKKEPETFRYFIKNSLKNFYNEPEYNYYASRSDLKGLYNKIKKERFNNGNTLKNALKDVCKELKNKIKKSPEELVSFLRINYELKNKNVEEIEFNLLENLDVLGHKVEFMKAYCKYNGIKILIDGKTKDDDRNYISNGFKNSKYACFQDNNSVFHRESLQEYIGYREWKLKSILDLENNDIRKKIKIENEINSNSEDKLRKEINTKGILRSVRTIGNYSELSRCLNEIKTNYFSAENSLFKIWGIEKDVNEIDSNYLNDLSKKFLKIIANKNFEFIKKENWKDSFYKYVEKYKNTKEGIVKFRTDDSIMFLKNIIDVHKKINSHILNKTDKEDWIKLLYLSYEGLIERDTIETKERDIERILFYKLIEALSDDERLLYDNEIYNEKKIKLLTLYFEIEGLYNTHEREKQLFCKIIEENLNKLEPSFFSI